MNVDSIADDAHSLGALHGRNAGSWVVKGPEQAAVLRRWIVDGDPRLDEIEPAPLSGEWTDSMTPDALRQELDADEGWEDEGGDEVCAIYEDAFREAFMEQVERDISAQLDD